MANPPYPPQGMPPGMPPGMQPGMPARPAGIPLAGTVKKGTPRIVPIIVSAGVAVGVFSGLYFGVGVPEESTAETAGKGQHTAPQGPKTAAAATNEVTNFKSGPALKKDGSGSGGGSAEGSAAGTGSAAVAAGSGAGTGSAAPAGAGSGSAAPGTGSGSAAPAADNSVQLVFDTTPATATITVDGKPVKGGKLGLAFEGASKSVKIVVKASGYKTWEKQMTIRKDNAEETFAIKLVKRSSGGSRDRDRDRGGDRDPPGGLIDL